MLLPVNAAMMDACVLAALERGDTYGYRITQELAGGIGASESTLYPILRRLESNAQINVRAAEHNGRLRKYYRITELGRARIEEFKREWRELLSIYEFVTREENKN